MILRGTLALLLAASSAQAGTINSIDFVGTLSVGEQRIPINESSAVEIAVDWQVVPALDTSWETPQTVQRLEVTHFEILTPPAGWTFLTEQIDGIRYEVLWEWDPTFSLTLSGFGDMLSGYGGFGGAAL